MTHLAKLLDNVRDELLAVLVVGNVQLVGFGLDLVVFRQLFDVFVSTLGTRGVGDGDIGTELSAAAGSFNAHAPRARGTSNDHDFAL